MVVEEEKEGINVEAHEDEEGRDEREKGGRRLFVDRRICLRLEEGHACGRGKDLDARRGKRQVQKGKGEMADA